MRTALEILDNMVPDDSIEDRPLIKICAKCSDMFSMSTPWGDYSGYVPQCIGSDSDYVEFTIDNHTGKILGWKPLSPKVVKELI